MSISFGRGSFFGRWAWVHHGYWQGIATNKWMSVSFVWNAFLAIAIIFRYG
jgi:hypothetical protein